MPDANKIAYVLKGFPRLSETFIANEVRQLTQSGLNLGLFSIKRGDELAKCDFLPAVHYLPIIDSTSSVTLVSWLLNNFHRFQSDHGYWIRLSTSRYLRTLAFAASCAFQYRTKGVFQLKKSFIKEFFIALHIARHIHQDASYSHIHAHFCHDATTVAWMVSQLCQIPFSFTAHAKDIYQKKLNPGNLLRRKIDACSFVVTCTQTNVKYLCQRTADPEKIFGIYHGLDTRQFTPDLSRRQTPPLLLSVGRHVEKKGFIYLLKACCVLRNRSVDFHLSIVGEQGDQSAVLNQAIMHYGLQKKVTLVPPVRQTELTAWYHRASVFVLPCIILNNGDRDGIPNVMAEAMACALPVVVSAISGIPEIIDNGINGLSIAERNSEALADAIQSLLEQPEYAHTLGQAAHRRIEAIFDADATHKDLKAVFESVLKGDVESLESVKQIKARTA